jgi:hypothetical protein
MSFIPRLTAALTRPFWSNAASSIPSRLSNFFFSNLWRGLPENPGKPNIKVVSYNEMQRICDKNFMERVRKACSRFD